MKLSDKVFDIVNKIQRWLPLLALFYLALCETWGLPYGNEIRDTVASIGVLLAGILEDATATYEKAKNQVESQEADE